MPSGPIDGQRERDQPGCCSGQVCPEQAQSRTEANGDGNRLDGRRGHVLTFCGRRRDSKLPAGCRPIGVNAAGFIVEKGAGHAKRVVGPVQRLDRLVTQRLRRIGQRRELFQDTGASQLLLGLVEFGQQAIPLVLVKPVDGVGESKGFRHRNRYEHPAAGGAALFARDPLAGLE